MLPFTGRVIEIIRKIPAGKVLTYGKIAALGGNPRAARQVAYIIHSCSRKYGLPWHRVINSKGRISLKEDGLLHQRELLEADGVIVEGDRVDLARYCWEVTSVSGRLSAVTEDSRGH